MEIIGIIGIIIIGNVYIRIIIVQVQGTGRRLHTGIIPSTGNNNTMDTVRQYVVNQYYSIGL